MKKQTFIFGLLLVTLLVIGSNHLSFAQMNKNDLGTLGGDYSVAAGMNDLGQIVGHSALPGGNHHAFVWTADRGMLDLGTLIGPSGLSMARSINNKGQIIGNSSAPGGKSHAILIDPVFGLDGKPIWFVDDNGDGANDLIIDLGFDFDELGGLGSDAEFINDNEEIVGYYSYYKDPNNPYLPTARAFFRTKEGQIHILPTLGGVGEHTSANSLNNLGQVVGWSDAYRSADSSDPHGFVWTLNGGIVNLGNFGGPHNNQAFHINNLGQIVGYAQTEAQSLHAFLVTPEKTNGNYVWFRDDGTGRNALMKDLHPSEASLSEGYFINDQGDIVGPIISNSIRSLGFWQGESLAHVYSANYPDMINDIKSLNNYGQVVGNFISHDDPNCAACNHPFLWSSERGFLDLGTLGGSSGFVNKINNLGHIVGSCQTPSENLHAVLWTFDKDIDVSPLNYNFGDVEVGASRTAIITISNLGWTQNLTVNSITAEPGSSPAFTMTPSLTFPFTVSPNNGTVDVEFQFTPDTAGTFSANFVVGSDDSDEPAIVITLTGNGVGEEPYDELVDILEFFDNSVSDGTLVGNGPGGSGEGRLKALRNMIRAAGDLIRANDIAAACQQLRDAYNRTDGNPRPPDFVIGEAASELATMISDLMRDLGCL